MKVLKALTAKAREILNRPRVVHYVEIFAGATGAALWFDRDQILGAHGLNALGCIALGAAATGGKAMLEAWRKSSSPPPPST